MKARIHIGTASACLRSDFRMRKPINAETEFDGRTAHPAAAPASVAVAVARIPSRGGVDFLSDAHSTRTSVIYYRGTAEQNSAEGEISVRHGEW